MMRRAFLLALTLFAGCRDVTLPPVPSPNQGGTLYGTVELAVAGGGHGPAAGTQIGILGSSLSTVAGAQGDFLLEGIRTTRGKILFRFGAGADAKQKLVRLEDVHAGPGRDIGIGEVILSENSALHGRVLLGDHVTARGGHGGTRVFVPQSPYQGFTADDGSFLIEGLPEGALDLSAFHAGYQPAGLAGIDLRAGESFELADVVLKADPDAMPGAIEGHVLLSPAGNAPITVAAIDSGGSSHGAIASGGVYSIASLPPDVYSVLASAPGYADAVVSNVLVPVGTTVSLPDIVVGQAGEVDAGFVAVDAGCTRCGDSCTTTLDCSATDWCDDGLCRPLCGSAADCGAGRACDGVTHTCVTPCTSGCPLGEQCDLNRNACEPACDLSTPCPIGLHCGAAGVCVPECVTSADCPGAHQMCSGGFCRPDGTCSGDPDCPVSQICLGGNCLGRDGGTVTVDGGVFFTCAQPCDCKQGEACYGGVCLPDLLPTRFVALGGTGDGGAPSQATGDLQAALSSAGVVALLASDTWNTNAGYSTDSGVTLLGGYVSCNPLRWVRDPMARTPLVSSGANVLELAGPNEAVRGLSFSALAPDCARATVHGVNVTGFSARELTLREDAVFACGATDLIRCEFCDGYSVDQIAITGSLAQSANPAVRGVHFVHGSGDVTGVDATGMAEQANFNPIAIESPDAPVSVHDLDYSGPPTIATHLVIDAHDCSSELIDISNNRIRQSRTEAGGAFTGIHVRCPNVRVTGNRLSGTAVPGSIANFVGLDVDDVAGVVDSNAIAPGDNGGAGNFTGIRILNGVGPLTVSNNVADAGYWDNAYGLSASNVSAGPLTISGNLLWVVSNSSTGIYVSYVSPGGGLHVVGNTAFADSHASSFTTSGLMAEHNVAGVIERNFLSGQNGGSAYGFRSAGGLKQLELYDNYLHAGPSLFFPGSLGVETESGSGQLWLAGNTIEGEGDVFSTNSGGIACTDNETAVFTSNLIGGGFAPNHPMVTMSAACAAGSSFTDNYFWYAASGGESASDQVNQVALVDGGVPDSNGNRIGDRLGCQVPHPTLTPWRIDAGTPCVDHGAAPNRQDTTSVTLDVEGQPRKVGGAPDIGCYEAQ